MTSPAFLRAGLNVQRDLRALNNVNPVRPGGLDFPTLTGYWDDVPRLVRLVRDLTEFPTLPQTKAQRVAGVVPSPNPDRMPGYTVPFVCRDTGGVLTMQVGITLAGVLASLRSLSHAKTRGYNETMRWQNVFDGALAILPRGQQRNTLNTALMQGHAIFDPNAGWMAGFMRLIEQLPRQLAVAEQQYLQELADRAVA